MVGYTLHDVAGKLVTGKVQTMQKKGVYTEELALNLNECIGEKYIFTLNIGNRNFVKKLIRTVK